MFSLLSIFLAALSKLFRTNADLQLENPVPRHQLSVLHRSVKRPKLVGEIHSGAHLPSTANFGDEIGLPVGATFSARRSPADEDKAASWPMPAALRSFAPGIAMMETAQSRTGDHSRVRTAALRLAGDAACPPPAPASATGWDTRQPHHQTAAAGANGGGWR
jgi:hypothetical protein